jgi:hypothetical protein
MFFADTTVTSSEKFNTMFDDADTPVALSAGTDDDNVGAVVSAAVVKFSAVDDEIPAYTLFAASLKAPESIVT